MVIDAERLAILPFLTRSRNPLRGVCEIFYWRDVTTCFTMTYSINILIVFVIYLKGKS